MMKFKNFCGIFATLFVTTTIILLASCSQDDDAYDNNEMYTLAEEMGTRSGGNGGDPGEGSHLLSLHAGSVDSIFDVPLTMLQIRYHMTWGTVSEPLLYSAEADITYGEFVNNSPLVHSISSIGQDTLIREYDYIDLVDNHLPAEYSEGNFVLDGVIVHYKRAYKEENSNIYMYGNVETSLASIRWKIPTYLIY